MRIEIRDPAGYSHVIESENPATIGLWFAEQAQKLMSVNAQYMNQVLINVWPTTDAERNTIGNPPAMQFSQTLLQDLADVLNRP